MANKKVTLKDGNDILYPQSVLNGIDTSNLLATTTITTSNGYMASEDCYANTTSSMKTQLLINNIVRIIAPSPSRMLVLLKKGQVITTIADSNTINIYGILK